MKTAILLVCAILACALPLQAGPLAIANHTVQEIINIRIDNPAGEIFLRLDLLPLASTTVENPDCRGDLRADTGLALWSFANIDLASATRLDFCSSHPVCLIVESAQGAIRHIDGSVTNLVPREDSGPSCELAAFHPAMSMQEVCSILPDSSPRDDNGAVLTSLGFAGMNWAARLIPDSAGALTAKTLLEHLELRRKLDFADLEKLLGKLFRDGYTAWQAEFPGNYYDFNGANAAADESLLLRRSQEFIQQQSGQAHKNHASGERCAEASILLAPRAMLPALASSDEPVSDVQLFTLTLRPCTQTLLVDVAAYGKQERSQIGAVSMP